MKINTLRLRPTRPAEWQPEESKRSNLFLEWPQKKEPVIEVLQTNPPIYRINGKIVEIPKEMSPEEYYENDAKEAKYKREGKESGSWQTLELRHPQKRPLWQDAEKDRIIQYADETTNGTESELHPLRKQYLETRLKDINYQERQQARQDSFTTALYGKKDYTEERDNILKELNGNAEKQFANEADNPDSPSKESKFTPAEPDEPSDFDRRKNLWENQKRWGEFQKSQHEGQSGPDFKAPNAFERLGVPDPKNPQESISEADKNRRDFYKFSQPNGQSTEAWDRANEYLRNTPRKDKQHNIIGSEIRCNTTLGRELSKLDIEVQKGVNMNTMIDHMDKSGDWADLPTDENGKPDHAKAVEIAKEGYIVVATEKGKEHGHAAILTGKEAESGTWKGKVPEVYGSVNGKPAKSEGISNHWQAKDKNNIKYKVYRYKRPI